MCPSGNADAPGLPSRSKVVADEFMGCDQTSYNTMDDWRQYLERTGRNDPPMRMTSILRSFRYSLFRWACWLATVTRRSRNHS
jgi:hypothetical protein